MPSYEKSKASGLWSCRFREVGEDGLTHQKRLSGFKTKKEAQYGYEDYIKEEEERRTAAIASKKAAEEAKRREPNEKTFAEIYAAYVDFKRQRVKPSTLYDMTKKIEAKILPFFGGYKIKDITPALVLQWQSGLAEFSYYYKKNLFSFLASVSSFGAKYYKCADFAADLDRPRNLEAKKEMQIWTPEEFFSAVSFEPSEAYYAFFCTLYALGCRRGEALALGWADIDFKKLTVTINKSITFKSTTKEAGKGWEVTTPKNKGSNRTVALPPFLADILADYKETAPVGPFVFGGAAPLPASSIERKLTACAAAAGVKRIRIHDLRHSCASYLIHSGVSVVAVSRQLGHTDVEQTLNTYSHLLPDDREQVRAALEHLGTKVGTKF